MSNSRRLRRPAGTAAAGPRCGSCGRRIPAHQDRIALRDGRLVCPRCRDAGVLCKKLPCGHYAVPGNLVIADSADGSNFQCIACSPHARLPAGYAGS